MTFKEYAAKMGYFWLSPKQAAKLMQCSVEHVYELAKSGKLRHIKDGKNIRFKPEDLDEYEMNHYYKSQYGTVQKKR